jgi:endonuclease YncB( thermonuclease family)
MKALLPLATALLALMPAAAFADQVLSVGDGDTITVTSPSGKTKIRLACIDAPEMSQRPAGPASRKALQALLPVGSTAELKVQTTDRYGRTVAEVLSNGRNINQAMVGQGMAFVYRKYLKGCDQGAYDRLERQAAAQRLGVWGPTLGYDLMMPWDYRACKRAGNCR